VEITRLHYDDDWSQQALSKRYKLSPATINRAIKSARDSGLVTITVTSNLRPPVASRDDLAKRLALRFDSVAHLFVLESTAPPRGGEEAYANWSDGVHRMLGHFLGSTHVRHAIADDDKIGVSSGRGVSQTIEGLLQENLLIQAQGVTLVSLTGSFEMRGQGNGIPTVMDGDNNVGRLAQAFGRMISLQTTGRGIVVEPQDQDKDAWIRKLPKKAIVGVGVIEGTNRFLSKTPTLKPIRGQLDALSSIVKECSTDAYVPCADMCNYLFWVKPPKGIDVAKEKEAEIRRQIDELNKRLFVMPRDVLKTGKADIWIAAGTPRKAAAIRQILNDGFRINALCIDTTLAQELDKMD
jgi:DNA-binding transcriptional regulator LsrR (DeoR family)